MSESFCKPISEIHALPNITFRQLEVFCMVCREGSYANAALELHSTRANIKRVCEDLEKAVGRPLFTEGPDHRIRATDFASSLLTQTTPLSRGLHRLGDCVKSLHAKGRILRFGAAGEFFKGGMFTGFLTRLRISDSFRPCFMRIEIQRFRPALLNAECDVYFGVGITASDRLELVDLGGIPWKFQPGPAYRDPSPTQPSDLAPGKWWIADAGDEGAGEAVLEAMHEAGAAGGRLLREEHAAAPDEIVLVHDIVGRREPGAPAGWPLYAFSAVLKKHHPYSDLTARLKAAAI
jgi:DNA-binding transcriptional LysR family regulator